MERRGHTLTIATYHIGDDIPEHLRSKIDVRRIRRWIFWYKKLEAGPDWQKLLLDIMLLRKTFHLARTQKPDVLYAHLHEGVLIGWIVQKLLFWRKMRLVIDLHGSLSGEMDSHGYIYVNIMKRAVVYAENWLNARGQIAVASSWEYAKMVNSIRAKDQQAEVLLDGVDINAYKQSLSRDDLRSEWGLPKNKLVFVYAGAFIANKGIGFLLEAIAEMKRCGCDQAFFVLAGWPGDQIEGRIQELGISDIVRVITPLRYFDLPKLLSVCDVAVDPKDSSTLQASGKILQYMAAGLPVVCFDRKNNHYYLGEGGYYAQEVSAHGLAQMFWKILDNNGHIKQKSRANFYKAHEFSWDKGALRMEELLAIQDGTYTPSMHANHNKRHNNLHSLTDDHFQP